MAGILVHRAKTQSYYEEPLDCIATYISPEALVAWDRDVPQDIITTHLRLYPTNYTIYFGDSIAIWDPSSKRWDIVNQANLRSWDQFLRQYGDKIIWTKEQSDK